MLRDVEHEGYSDPDDSDNDDDNPEGKNYILVKAIRLHGLTRNFLLAVFTWVRNLIWGMVCVLVSSSERCLAVCGLACVSRLVRVFKSQQSNVVAHTAGKHPGGPGRQR